MPDGLCLCLSLSMLRGKLIGGTSGEAIGEVNVFACLTRPWSRKWPSATLPNGFTPAGVQFASIIAGISSGVRVDRRVKTTGPVVEAHDHEGARYVSGRSIGVLRSESFRHRRPRRRSSFHIPARYVSWGFLSSCSTHASARPDRAGSWSVLCVSFRLVKSSTQSSHCS